MDLPSEEIANPIKASDLPGFTALKLHEQSNILCDGLIQSRNIIETQG
jgi:hypothetical protein